MKRGLAAAVLVVAGCGSGDNGNVNPDGNMSSDANPTCMVTLTHDPAHPISGPGMIVTETASLSSPLGVPTYTWTVQLHGTSTQIPFTGSGSQIEFPVDNPGLYDVTAMVDQACLGALDPVTVNPPGANVANYRFRVWPAPMAGAPPQETVVQVQGGADFTHAITLDPGLAVMGSVQNSVGVGVAAYVRFLPVASPEAYVEQFVPASGALSVRLLGQSHQVLIVPAVAGLAPRLATWSTTSSSTFTLSAGSTLTGTVLDGAGTPIAGAQVQLAQGILPSSLATTLSDGSFTIHHTFAAGMPVAVNVVPPVGRGLPRLAATAAFDLTQPMQIHYATITTCNVGGAAVQRGASAVPGAQVTLVGTLAGTSGTITAGTAANATGSVRVATTADGTGHLPTTLAPRVALSAVVTVAPGDLAVSNVNLSTCAVTTISAPLQALATGHVLDPAQAPVAGVRLEATGDGPLAGALAVQAKSGTGGAFSLPLAAGGTYDVRFVDPLGRGAPLVVPATTPGNVPAMPALAAALHVSGTIFVSGDSNPYQGTSLQILCAGCTGVAAATPIAETATDRDSQYLVAVPDPGTM